MFTNNLIFALLGALLVIGATVSRAQDDDEYEGGNQGANNQGDSDNYGGGGGNSGYDDGGYSGNNYQPSYQQNVDSDGTNQSPNSYSPQGGSDVDGDYEGDDGSAAAAASSNHPTVLRFRRSLPEGEKLSGEVASAESAPKLRVKRHGKYYIGPVYTYVKTDKHANFKWGVKHKVGKKHYG